MRCVLPLILAVLVAACARAPDPALDFDSSPLPGAPRGSGVHYSTRFNAEERPVSEDGRWEEHNTWFTKVVTQHGIAFGTSPNPAVPGRYVDSYAILDGKDFPPDQYASAHLYKGATGGYMEVELLLRASDTGNSTRMYECYLQQDGTYVTVARWQGKPLDALARLTYFDELARRTDIRKPADGDLFEAWIIGNIITVRLAGEEVLKVDVSRFDGQVIPAGQPGMAFNLGHSGAEKAGSGYGFRDFSAMGL